MGKEKENINLTKEQLEAVSTDPVSDRIVIAMAGSGKTTVLTEYYLRLMDSGFKPSEIIAVTFTDRAARSMRAKLNKKLSDMNRVDLAEEIQRAPISTIHSFLADLIRENSLTIGLDPDWRVIDEMQADILMEEVLRDLMRAWKESKPEKYKILVSMLLWGKDPYQTFCSYWMKIKSRNLDLSDLNPGLDMTPFVIALQGAAIEGTSDYIYDLENHHKPLTSTENRRLVLLKDLLHLLKSFDPVNCSISNINEISEYFKGGQISGRVSVKFEPHQKYLKEKVFDLLCASVNIMGKEVRETLIELIVAFDLEYSRAKRLENSLDFNDLEYFAKYLLTENPLILEKIKASYRALLIDEFQDTNPVQMSIIDLIRPSPGFFAVGDPRQSIYGFRDADVGIMLKEIDDFKKTSDKKVIELHTNYRSCDGILSFISDRFKNRIIDSGFPSYTFQVFDAGHKFELKQGKPVDVIISIGDKIQDVREIETKVFANSLVELLNSGFKVEGSDGSIRDLKPSDCAILSRTRSNLIAYSRALEEKGIPYTVYSGAGFFNQREIMDLVNYLSLLIEPTNAQLLSEVLRAPFYGISANALFVILKQFDISSNVINGRFWLKSEIDLAKNSKYRFEDLQSDFKFLVENSIGEGPSSRLRMILDRTHFRGIMMRGVGGRRRLGNIMKLLDFADEWESNYPGDNAGFVSRMKDLRFRDVREPESIIPEDSDSVLLMTMHASKGLEYPVVYVADALSSGLQESSSWLLGRKNEVLVKHGSIEEGQIENKDIVDRQFKDERDYINEKDSYERFRVLYVALSRAINKLVVGIPVKRAKNLSEELSGSGIFADIFDFNINDEIPNIADSPDSVFSKHFGNEISIRKLENYKKAGIEKLPIDIKQDMERIKKWGRDFDQSNSAYAATEITSWMICPRQYECKYVKNLGVFEGDVEFIDYATLITDPEELVARPRIGGNDEFPATKRGSLIHDMLYQCISRPEIFDIEHFVNSNQCFGLKLDISNLKEIFEYVINSEKIRNALLSETRIYEELIYFTISGFAPVFKAMPDMAWLSNGKWNILDYKTGQSHYETDIVGRAYAQQLRMYALAIRAFYKKDVEYAACFYVDNKEYYQVSVDEESLEKSKDILRLFFDAVQNREFPAQKNEFCGHCSYSNGCPVY